MTLCQTRGDAGVPSKDYSMRATFDPEELRRWARSEGAAVIKAACRESRDKLKALERSQRVEPERLMKQITR